MSLCDITDQDSVNCWARPVAVQVDSELDLLISSAEVLTPGPVEVLPLDPIQREFEVNVLGAMAVIYAFLPKLRRARERIVQIST